jgi:hypothetical protein|tara:strand:+ start:83 stop:427 length:345 start_codon:yes stop_codon:yes gene_type:complete
MATRNYIQAAAPYATINSTCFVASVQKSRVGNKLLIPVYIPPGHKVPSNQNDILRMIDGIAATENGTKPIAEIHSDAFSMSSAKIEHGSCIDGAIADYEHAQAEFNAEVPTVSF